MQQLKFLKIFFGLILIAQLIFSCQPPASKKQQENPVFEQSAAPILNVYTYRASVEHRDLVQRFGNLTGGKVEFKIIESEVLADQIIGGTISPDLIITDNLSPILKIKDAGLLQPFSTGNMEENIPSKYKDNDGFWMAMGKSGIAVVFNSEKIKTGEINTYTDLTNAKYKGKILISSLEETTNRQLLAGMIAGEGEAAANRFAKGLLDNQAKPPAGTDVDVIKGVSSGEGDLGLVDMASVLRFRYSGNPEDFKTAENLAMVYPVNKDGITYLTFRYIAMPKSTSNRQSALRFAEYLTNESAQQVMSAGSFIFPANPMVIPSDFLIDQGGYQDLGTDLNKIGQLDDQINSIAESLNWN